jgi:hypothetical protein
MDMQDIAEMFGEKLPEYWPKERMAHRLEEIYTREAGDLLAMFSYPVISFLASFFEKEPSGILDSTRDTDPVFGDMEQIYDQLEYMGLIDFEAGRGTVSPFLPDVVLKIRTLPHQLEEWQEMELCALGILDVYGLMEESHFLDVFYECYPRFSRDQAYSFLSRRIEIRIMSYVTDMGSGFWWFSDLVDEPEEWYAAMQRRAEIPYRPYSRADFIDFAVFAFCDPPRHYDELFGLLLASGLDEEDAETVLTEDIMGHRCQAETHLDLPEFIRDIVSSQSMPEAKKVLDLYIEFVNSIPTWLNKGNAPTELRSRLTIPLRPAPDSAPRKSNVIPFPTARKKTGRNEPCPCGSGKKYKDCCGKNKQDE